MRKVLLFVFFSPFCLIGQNLEYQIEKPNSSNSLPSNIVYSVNQSEEGYVFFGTDEGLVKYNGLFYETISLNTTGKAIHNIICDKNKVYGLTFNKELFIWTKNEAKIFSDKDGLSLSKLTWIKMIGDSLFVFSPSSFQIINKQTMKVVYSNSEKNNSITWDVYKQNNQLKVFYDNYKIDLIKDYKEKIKVNSYSNQIIKPFIVTFKNKILCLDFINNNAYQLIGEKKENLKWDFSELNNQKIHSVQNYQNKFISVATYNGLYLLNEDGKIQQHLLKGVPVSNVYENLNGELLIATLNDGVFYIPNSFTSMFDLKNFLNKKDKIHRALFDQKKIILGTHQGHVLIYNLTSNHIDNNQRFRLSEVQSISKVNDNYYVYCEKLYQLDTSLNVLDSIKITATKSVSNINDNLYIGTSQGIYLYKNKTKTEEFFTKYWFKSLYKDKLNQKLYANKDNGLYIFDVNANQWCFDSTKQNFQLNINTGVQAYTSNDNLILNYKKITKKSLINSSLKKYYLTNNFQYILQFQDSLKIHNLFSDRIISLKKGIDYNNQNIIKCDILNDTLILVFSDKIQFVKLQIKKNLNLPKIVVNNCSHIINNDSVFIDYNGAVDFDFDILSSIHDKGKSQLFYNISDIHKQWIPIQPNTKNYSLRIERLPPGSYLMEIKAVSDRGIISNIKKFNIDVASPFWQKWWFIVFLFLIVSFTVFTLIKIRLNKIKNKNKKELYLKRLEIQSLNSKLEALQSQMNPHFIFNSLNSIQTLVLKGDVESSYEYINKFADLMRQTLSFSENQLIPFHGEVELLNNYLILEKLRFRDEFNYKIITNGISEVNVPPMLLQPFIENALKHGLLHKESDRKLNIEFKLEKELICTIIDNGIGRKAAKEIKKRQNKFYKSYALESLQERFEYLSQKMNIENIGFTYHDLYENDLPVGTKVVVQIPFVKNN